jgi:hypothetical protein
MGQVLHVRKVLATLTPAYICLQALKRRVDGAPITILTHSAGGWLGRVYLLVSLPEAILFASGGAK